MQPQSSSAIPAAPPPAGAPAPAVVRKAPVVKPPSRAPLWIALIVVAGAIAGYAYWRKQSAAEGQAAVARAVRTATVAGGVVTRTVRLTGTTAAENSASIIVPQMRGSRGDYGRGGGSQSASTPPSLSPAPSNIGPQGSGGGGNLSSALRASTSRVGGSTASTSKSSSSSSASASSATMGSTGLGSTADSLQGGGGGGGGMDFSINLQKLVNPGSRVRKGEVIAELDRQYMLMRLDDYRASVVQTQAALLKLKADLTVVRHARGQALEKAKADLEKAKLDLKTLPVLSAIDSERAKLAVELYQARYNEAVSETKLVETSLNSQIRNAEINLAQTNIELRRAETNADRMLLRSPIDGMTVMATVPVAGDLRQIKEGDQLYPGMLFMSVVDTRSMIINSSVNQADVEKLRIGAKATVRFDAYPGLELPAHVYSVGGIAKPGGQRASYVKEIPVRLKLDGTDARVIPDLTVSADVVLASEASETAVVPVGAIQRDQPGTPAYVFVRAGEGWTRRNVELGLSNHVQVAVRSGLNRNEVVALEPPAENAAARAEAP